MARIDAGVLQVQQTWTTAAEVVEAACAHAAASLTGRDLRVEADDEIGVEIDPRLTSSALAHLLENAARYSKDGSIEVRGWVDAEGLRVEVRDTGPGLQPVEMARLFEPFYRGEAVRQTIAGTGMGLAIARGLLAAEGGRVWAENLAPHGAVFAIAVPARTRQPAVAR